MTIELPPKQPTKPALRQAATGFTALVGNILHETDKAVLIALKEVDEEGETVVREHWFPLSQVGYIHRPQGFIKINKEFTDTIHVTSWLVNKKGIEV